MDPVIGGALIAGGGQLAGDVIGSILGNSSNQEMQNKALQFNAQQAQINRDWQEEMSNTAYQRSVKDMQAAGINPMLAYMKGGASTPGGAQASATSPPKMEYSLGRGIGTALDARRLANELQATEADVELKKVGKQVQEQVMKREASNARVAEANAKVAEANLPAEIEAAQAARKHAEYDNKLADTDAIGKRVQMGTGIVNDALGALRLGRGRGLGGFGTNEMENEVLRRRGRKGMLVP